MSSNNIEYASILSKSEVSSLLLKPTIFDILAQENMHSLFRQAFNHILKWLSSIFPSLARLKKFTDELYLLLHSTIEYLYLKAYNSLFSEHFYGLKRHGLTTDKKRILSILFSIVIPYLKAKLDNFYEELEKEQDSPVPAQTSTKFKKIFLFINKITLKVYPYFHMLWSGLFWYYRFRFMISSSEYNSPLLSILGLKLVYDMDKDKNQTSQGWLISFLLFSNNVLTNALYFIQFLKWYQDYSENQSYSIETYRQLNPGRSNQVDEIIPPPNKLPEKIANNKMYKVLTENGMCPLCSKKRTNECVLSVSGFVFCYPCIFKFIKAHQRCPLTNYPCTTKNIIRIFSTE